MANTTVAGRFTTVSISTGGDTVTTRGYHCMVRNLGANQVSVSEDANPTAAPTVGLQSTINPIPTTGAPDGVLVGPNRKVYLRAVAGATLVAVEEVQHPYFQTNP